MVSNRPLLCKRSHTIKSVVANNVMGDCKPHIMHACSELETKAGKINRTLTLYSLLVEREDLLHRMLAFDLEMKMKEDENDCTRVFN